LGTITAAELERLNNLNANERAESLAGFADDFDPDALEGALQQEFIDVLLAAVEGGGGTARARMLVGEMLGKLGDPRLYMPQYPSYWRTAPLLDGGSLELGRFPVTNSEFYRFVEDGGYDDESHWTEAGRAWLAADGTRPWRDSSADTDEKFLVDNQPVVGISWFEAAAYASWAGGRLLTFQERMGVVRGPGKRPYPWGEPFGHGNANTREEVLARPCAVGLYRRDCTPEGVFDLAGNVAEWVEDEVDEQRVIAPGAWSQESLSSWAKARALQAPECRGSDLGFRIARG